MSVKIQMIILWSVLMVNQMHIVTAVACAVGLSIAIYDYTILGG